MQECALKKGIAFMGEEVEYDNFLGERVSGSVLAVDKSKTKMKAEMMRLRGMNDNDTASISGQESDTVRSLTCMILSSSSGKYSGFDCFFIGKKNKKQQ